MGNSQGIRIWAKTKESYSYTHPPFLFRVDIVKMNFVSVFGVVPVQTRQLQSPTLAGSCSKCQSAAAYLKSTSKHYWSPHFFVILLLPRLWNSWNTREYLWVNDIIWTSAPFLQRTIIIIPDNSAIVQWSRNPHQSPAPDWWSALELQTINRRCSHNDGEDLVSIDS